MKGALAQYSSSTPLKVIQRLRVAATNRRSPPILLRP